MKRSIPRSQAIYGDYCHYCRFGVINLNHDELLKFEADHNHRGTP